MEKALKGLKVVICVMDDIFVNGKNSEEHWIRLKTFLKRIEKSGMMLRKEKYLFGFAKIMFFGHVISGRGIKPDPDKMRL